MRSTDGGLTWIWIGGAMSEAGAEGLSFLNGTSIAFEPGDTSTFWIQSYVRDIYGNGVILTSDGGETFAKVPGTQHRYSTVVGRAVNGMGEEVLFQADNCAQASSMKIDRF